MLGLEKGLFINGRLLAHKNLVKEILLKGKDEIYYSGDEIVAVRAVTRNFEEVKKKAKAKRVNLRVLKYPWELVAETGAQILADKKYLKGKKTGQKDKTVKIYKPQDVIIDVGAEVEANTVIDARQGPVYIGLGTIIRPLTYLKGPLSIGPQCRIGGEVGESIIHGYSNKQHYGFIGHSYIGEWVNLGAGTTNSDLKNNYGTVKVIINGKSIDSGEKFVGCFIGDHAKTGIGTLITTGAMIGVAANIFGGGVTAKETASFSWGSKGTYELEKMIKNAELVMGRRGKNISAVEKELLRKVFKLSQDEGKKS